MLLARIGLLGFMGRGRAEKQRSALPIGKERAIKKVFRIPSSPDTKGNPDNWEALTPEGNTGRTALYQTAYEVFVRTRALSNCRPQCENKSSALGARTHWIPINRFPSLSKKIDPPIESAEFSIGEYSLY